jgi:hypothetical protein
MVEPVPGRTIPPAEYPVPEASLALIAPYVESVFGAGTYAVVNRMILYVSVLRLNRPLESPSTAFE